MKNSLFLLLLAVGVGIGIGVGFGAMQLSRPAPEEPSIQNVSARIAESLSELPGNSDASEMDPEQLALMVESLMQILNEEIAERQVLAEQVEELQAELADSQQNLRARVEAAFAMESRITTTQQTRSRVELSMDERLVASGFTLEQVQALRRRESGAQMRQIELDDQARREGWINTPRYYEESNNLTSGAESVRAELGDDAYDRYLFASGRPNRLVVGSVIATSPAELAGFQPGDIITRYGGEKVFSNQQLISLRSSGNKGSSVVVEIVRDGEPMRISMPRGPMGIHGDSTVVDPSGTGR